MHFVIMVLAAITAGTIHQLPLPEIIRFGLYVVLGGIVLVAFILPTILRIAWRDMRTSFREHRHQSVIHRHWHAPAPRQTIELAFKLASTEGILREFQERMSQRMESPHISRGITVGDLWTQLSLARVDGGIVTQVPRRLFRRHNSISA